jgi:peptidyl-prolyl cis-trans isomerase B (cyclophilin B)
MLQKIEGFVILAHGDPGFRSVNARDYTGTDPADKADRCFPLDQLALIIRRPNMEIDYMITLHTNLGDIALELNFDKAPLSAANFLAYARDGFFNGTVFHRVINDFMIQGGGFDAEMQQKPTKPAIANEADNGLKNDFGTVAMARTNDPNSATAQFFINVKDNNFLNHTAKNPQGWGYAVFGKIVDNEDTINAIKAVATGNRSGHQDVPLENVSIESVTISDAYADK